LASPNYFRFFSVRPIADCYIQNENKLNRIHSSEKSNCEDACCQASKSTNNSNVQPTFLDDNEQAAQFPTFVTRGDVSERYGADSKENLKSIFDRHVTK
jgi:hypothetical protein